MPQKKKRRPSVSRKLKIAALASLVVATVLVLGALFLVQQERLVRGAAEAASFTPAPIATADKLPMVADSGADASAEAARTAINFPSGRPLNALFVGDSITYGLYATTEDERWASLISADLAQYGPVETSVVAAPGRTTVDALADVTPPNQDLIFVLLGNNDISKLDVEAFASSYEELLTRLQAESPEGKLVCVSPYVPAVYGPEYVTIEQDLCEAAGAAFVDIRSINEQAENRSVVGTPWFEGAAEDTSHPSDAGHQAIADAILETLTVS